MNNEQKDVIALRQVKEKELILGQLRRVPIIQVVCEKVGIARATFYRLRNDDLNFKLAVEEAITEGISFITDMSESQLISLIKDKNWPAISFWLRAHHPKYSTKVEVIAKIQQDDTLTLEQKALVEKALQMANLPGTKDPQKLDESN